MSELEILYTIKSKVGDQNFYNDDVLRIKNPADTFFEMNDFIEMITNVTQHVNENYQKKIPVIVDSRLAKDVSMECKEYLLGEEVQAVCSHIAVIINESFFGRLVANLIKGGNHGEMKAQFFKDMDSAEKWIEEQKKN